jgi:hypothetical protein
MPWYLRHVGDDDRERAIEAIIAPSRQRSATPRWLWITALVVAAACTVAFVIVLARGGDPTSSGPTPATAPTGHGFATGLALGTGVGIAIGFLIARRPQSSVAQAADHSSRSRP